MRRLIAPSAFRELVSGQRRGIVPAVLRGCLGLAELPYTLAVTWRNRRFDRQAGSVYRASVPIISVGNMTMGGTGKTPMVAWLADWFRRRDARVALISRGYGAKTGSCNDEALELQQRLPDVPHAQSANRVEAAQLAIEQWQCELIILDDAFQHRRIARDLDIVLLDALEPFGFGRVFPRGTLREPLDGLSRADIVALSRADLVTNDQRAAIRQRASRLAPAATWVELAHDPVRLQSASNRSAAIDSLAGKRVAAFCGIGNPAGFRRTLQQCDFHVVDFREFPDHHAYTHSDAQSLGAWAHALPADAVICTHKDLVKIARDRLHQLPLWAVCIGVKVSAGQVDLERHLERVAGRIKQNG